MGFLDIDQSVPICIGMALLGGALEVVANGVVAYSLERKKLYPDECHLPSCIVTVIYAIIQVMASFSMNAVAVWFGPVSLVQPMIYTSQMTLNVFMYWYFLGWKALSKDMKISTYIMILSAVIWPNVGPTAKDNEQDNMDMVLKPWALVWVICIMTVMIVAAMLVCVIDKFGKITKLVLLLALRTAAPTVNMTVTKFLPFTGSPEELLTMVGIKILSGALITFAIRQQVQHVEHHVFVPFLACSIIFFNVISGLIVWEEWDYIQSWPGYVSVFFLTALGLHLLLTEIELLGSDHSKYGRTNVIDHARHRDDEGDDNSRPLLTGDENPTEGAEEDGNITESFVQARTRTAVLSMYGLTQSIMQSQDNDSRRGQIFVSGPL